MTGDLRRAKTGSDAVVGASAPFSPPQHPGGEPPRISVVIPSFNRNPLLLTCLAALQHQTLDPALFEVIVVLDGCTDGSAEVLSAMRVRFRLTTVSQLRAGSAAARNRGVAAASGAFCLFIDDDIVLDPEAVKAHLEMQERQGEAIVVGRISTVSTRNGFPSYFVEFWNRLEQRLRHDLSPSFADCFTGNLSVPTGRLEEVGGFSVVLPRGEDVELAFRLRSGGLPIVYAPDAAALQDFRKSTRECLRDTYLEGVAAVTLFRQDRAIAQWLTLGRLAMLPPPIQLLVRLISALPIPTRVLVAFGLLPAGRGLSNLVFRAMHGYCYVRGARATATGEEWRLITTSWRPDRQD